MVKVFVNHVDTFTGKTVAKVLSQSVVGASRELGGDEEEETGEPAGGSGNCYEVVGTLSEAASTAGKQGWATEIVEASTRDDLLAVLQSCDVIVYNIGDSSEQVEEATWAVQTLHDQLSTFASQKVFICISTIMSWARTKPLNIDEPDVPFTEEDYRRRRPHPGFKPQITAEKLVIKLGKTDATKFTTYVVASGLSYGREEGIFHFLFKSAWLGDEPALKLFGEGKNMVPTIHIDDLASIIVNIADCKPGTRYVLGVDDSNNSLEEIVTTISRSLGTGRVQNIPRVEAFALRELETSQCEQLLVDLQLEATLAKDSMSFAWKSLAGLVDNITPIIKEYKKTRGLLPIRLCILGPPAVGKTTVIQQLCSHYKLYRVALDEVIKESIIKLEQLAARADIDDDDEENDQKAQEAKEHLEVLKDNLEENNGRYSTEHIVAFVKEKLKSMPCQNQGFVLDGFPKTYEEAQMLFAPDGNEDEDDDDDGPQPEYNKLLMPELVVSLEASNEFLKERVINLPQSKVEGTHNTEEGLLRRLKLFRELNQEDVTVLNYFDELEIHPESIKVEGDNSAEMENTVEAIKKIIGEPRNYGPTPEEKAQMEAEERREKERKEAREREEMERQEALEKELRAKRQAEWDERLAQVQHEEQEMLETQSIPLRNYLMRHVMPTLTQGLMEVCNVRPDDPVDYLAEYLFKYNPQID